MLIEELKSSAGDIAERMEHLKEFLKIEARKAELTKLEETMSQPDFWDKKEEAQSVVTKLSSCRNIIEPYEKLLKEVGDFAVLVEFAEEDAAMLAEAEIAYKQLGKKLDELEILSFLSGKFDRGNFYFSIHAGAGGTESCDWANMLFRMYRRFFEQRGWREEIMDVQPGDEAGIKSMTARVEGEFGYGYMKGEKGVHRLVRISPFDSNARRHTSFVSVDVFPEIDDDVELEIDEKNLRIDTFRSSGAGGQHVNTTDSAVRITHLPSGIVVSCQNERSQHKNRASAMKMLKAKLYELEEEKRRNEADELRGEKMENGWGSQIRSYVLQPYQMVKDLRTGYETSNTSGVLDGEIDDFIESYLKSSK